ncbi:N-acetylglucosamine-6-phosphate deacetylase [Haliangium ochraceum]|uniref:N-acetylglucosamine-6-phosphate deacetylase n=1 Tax=Haliangium ochraceum (strain DSM 14365 / JCM 11303 / SMP-2) TaxID=502025 RepID=D0LVP6_HALO1|nr:N-acetylglucosamine-6-phosphate deacetylase [Haliangium ochraceum]ACY14030.1 N-acetylglucosamine-6-phosphate deacetylase [Haliangium ochraceum DSM 14365]
MIHIQHATIITPEQRLEDASVFASASQITSVSAAGEGSAGVRERERAAGGEPIIVDARGLYLVPGFIDLQCNGAFGSDFTADPATIWSVAAKLPRFGVTSFLPTIITAPSDAIAHAQAVLREPAPADASGARPLGLHLEGPFLNPRKRGAHEICYLRAPSSDAIARWDGAHGIRLVTLAPELPGALDLVGRLSERGVVVSAGHSCADYETAQRAFAAGVSYGTHLFNAMPTLDHREPALGGALLDHDGVTVGLIADGVHVHPAVIRLIWRAKGKDRLTLVSDGMAGMGMAPGRYRLNESEVRVEKTCARLADGTLAGSITPIDAGLRNLIATTGCTLEDALATVTSTPARVLGLEHRYGRIAPGYSADLVLLSRDLQVVMTVSAGEITYTREDDHEDGPDITLPRDPSAAAGVDEHLAL